MLPTGPCSGRHRFGLPDHSQSHIDSAYRTIGSNVCTSEFRSANVIFADVNGNSEVFDASRFHNKHSHIDREKEDVTDEQ